jgi:hypothetical protein
MVASAYPIERSLARISVPASLELSDKMGVSAASVPDSDDRQSSGDVLAVGMISLQALELSQERRSSECVL